LGSRPFFLAGAGAGAAAAAAGGAAGATIAAAAAAGWLAAAARAALLEVAAGPGGCVEELPSLGGAVDGRTTWVGTGRATGAGLPGAGAAGVAPATAGCVLCSDPLAAASRTEGGDGGCCCAAAGLAVAGCAEDEDLACASCADGDNGAPAPRGAPGLVGVDTGRLPAAGCVAERRALLTMLTPGCSCTRSKVKSPLRSVPLGPAAGRSGGSSKSAGCGNMQSRRVQPPSNTQFLQGL
jgi:hypothetical protein